MFKLKFMDGTPVDTVYAAAIAKLVRGAADATQHCSEDELEAHSANLATQSDSKNENKLLTFDQRYDIADFWRCGWVRLLKKRVQGRLASTEDRITHRANMASRRVGTVLNEIPSHGSRRGALPSNQESGQTV